MIFKFHQFLTLISGVTRGLTQGRNLSWRGPTNQNLEKMLRKTVDLQMSVLDKNKNTKNAKKQSKAVVPNLFHLTTPFENMT